MGNLFDLHGRVAIVTGGNGGIGLGMARGLAGAGASVVVAARNADKSDAAVLELQSLGVEALAVGVDVTDEQSVQAMVDQAVAWRRPARHPGQQRRHQHPQAGAGSLARRVAARARRQPDERIPVLRSAYPHMQRAGGGKIVNIGSMTVDLRRVVRSGVRGEQGRHRAADKVAGRDAGRRTTSRSTRCCPAGSTPSSRAVDARRSPGSTRSVLAGTPAGRWGHIDDFAGIAVFLASAASDFLTGTAIPLDGGYSTLL